MTSEIRSDSKNERPDGIKTSTTAARAKSWLRLRLEVSEKKVAEVYKSACFLRVDSAAKVAAKYLVENLSPANAIGAPPPSSLLVLLTGALWAGVRKCANKTSDFLLAASVDDYIQRHIADIVAESPEFMALPCVQVGPSLLPILSLALALASQHSPGGGAAAGGARLRSQAPSGLPHAPPKLPPSPHFRPLTALLRGPDDAPMTRGGRRSARVEWRWSGQRSACVAGRVTV